MHSKVMHYIKLVFRITCLNCFFSKVALIATRSLLQKRAELRHVHCWSIRHQKLCFQYFYFFYCISYMHRHLQLIFSFFFSFLRPFISRLGQAISGYNISKLQKEVSVPAYSFQFKLPLQLGSEAHAPSWLFVGWFFLFFFKECQPQCLGQKPVLSISLWPIFILLLKLKWHLALLTSFQKVLRLSYGCAILNEIRYRSGG